MMDDDDDSGNIIIYISTICMPQHVATRVVRLSLKLFSLIEIIRYRSRSIRCAKIPVVRSGAG